MRPQIDGKDGRRFLHKTQGLHIHRGRVRRMVRRGEQKRTVRLLARAEIAVERMVQQTPANMHEIAPGCQDMQRRRVTKKAGKTGGKRERPHTVRTDFRPGASQVAPHAAPHTWIVGQQDERHRTGLHAVCLCRRRVAASECVRPYSFCLRDSVSLSPSAALNARSRMAVIRVCFLDGALL